MQKSTSYYDLEVWQEAIKLAKNIYQLTESFPAKETYGLGLQLRRSAVSIASNLAEGQARNSHKEFLYFINISLGSLAELETQLIIAREINLIDAEILQPIFALTRKITKMAHGLKNHLTGKKR